LGNGSPSIPSGLQTIDAVLEIWLRNNTDATRLIESGVARYAAGIGIVAAKAVDEVVLLKL
jgi:hypothetical protein